MTQEQKTAMRQVKEQEAKNAKIIKDNTAIQAQIQKERFKQEARSTALSTAPRRKEDNRKETNPQRFDLTAKEIVEEAEIIYKWLIKDL